MYLTKMLRGDKVIRQYIYIYIFHYRPKTGDYNNLFFICMASKHISNTFLILSLKSSNVWNYIKLPTVSVMTMGMTTKSDYALVT